MSHLGEDLQGFVNHLGEDLQGFARLWGRIWKNLRDFGGEFARDL